MQVTDSAAAATAMYAGIKVNAGTLGLDSSGIKGMCNTTESSMIDQNIMTAANMAGTYVLDSANSFSFYLV